MAESPIVRSFARLVAIDAGTLDSDLARSNSGTNNMINKINQEGSQFPHSPQTQSNIIYVGKCLSAFLASLLLSTLSDTHSGSATDHKSLLKILLG